MIQFMENMTVSVVSVVENNGRVRARARAVAQDATIMIEVRFHVDKGASKADLWLEARYQCLRYLDIG